MICFDHIIIGTASAGCFSIGGNSNSPTIMIAERAAEMILADNR